MALAAALTGLRSLVPSMSKGVGGVTKDAFFGGGAFKGGIRSYSKEHPVLAGLSAIGAYGLATEVVPPMVEGVYDDFTTGSTTEVIQQYKRQEKLDALQQGMMQRQQAVEQELAKQSARLAAANPHLYNQIIAGRRLPQGAVILGGNPRTDLMEQIASGMASNPQLQQPGPSMAPQDQFLNELGV